MSHTLIPLAAVGLTALSMAMVAVPAWSAGSNGAKSIVLVHGGFVDGSGWEGVYNILKKDGYNVSIVQNPTMSLAGDVAATKLVLDAQDGPVDPRRPFLRRRGHHRGRQRSEGRGAGLHRRLRAGRGRVGRRR